MKGDNCDYGAASWNDVLMNTNNRTDVGCFNTIMIIYYEI